ncbi:MAG: hypothetical protein ABFD90_05965 [Phycisphaerales bacterium]
MKARAILPAMALLFAAGCSGPKPEFYWYHPGKTFEEARADYAECKIQAEDEAAKAVEDKYFDRLRSPAVLASGEDAPAPKKKSDDPSLKAKAEWGAVYKQNAFAGCMESRGYVKLKDYQVSDTVKTKQLPLGAIAGKRE